MTTNKTIDGVPREAVSALEKARDVLRAIIRDKAAGVHYASAQAACHQINGTLDELRALLEVPAVDANSWRLDPSKRCPQCVGHGTYLDGALCGSCGGTGKPADQPQGEPVYMVRSHGSDCWEEMSGESLELCQADTGEYEVRKLYAEQPAKPAMSPLPGVYPDREQPAPVAVCQGEFPQGDSFFRNKDAD